MTPQDFIGVSSPGALPVGTRIVKTNSNPGEIHADGDPGVVIGSLPPFQGQASYWVQWDNLPGVPVFVAAERVRAVGGRS